jgi:hypothetical protein
MNPQRIATPIATATIEPLGRRDGSPRQHMIKVTLELSAGDAKHADSGQVAGTVRQSLGVYSPSDGAPDRRTVRELTETRRGKAGLVTNIVVAIEGSVVWPDRPGESSDEDQRASLAGEGYRVVVRERRECSEARCTTDAMVDWRRPDDVPGRWFSNHICGRHDYRTCAKCKSVYQFTSENAVVPAPAVHCEVCGIVMVEWGSSKVWTPQLVTRGASAS